MEFDRYLIDKHEQRYDWSCIPSAIEMVLKLLQKVGSDFYELQDNWKEKKDGNFSDFDGTTIRGLRFKKLFGNQRGPDFPKEDLYAKINEELNAKRFVIISLAVLNGWHMFVLFKKIGDEYLAFSKNGKSTLINNNVGAIIDRMQGTDILVYENID